MTLESKVTSRKDEMICINCDKNFHVPNWLIKRGRKYCSLSCKNSHERKGKHQTLRGGGYYAVHKWLNRWYGKAHKCEQCKTKTSPMYQWSLLKGKKCEHKRENFWMLCAKCHWHYDYTPERIEKMAKTKQGKATHWGIKKVSQYKKDGSFIKSWPSIGMAVKETGMHYSSISSCLSGRYKSAGGYLWKNI